MNLSVKPVKKNASLVDQVVEQLRSSILEGSLSFGQKMPSELTLAEQMGVSRTVVREALRTMRGMGMIEIDRGKSARVRTPDARHVVDSLHFYLGRQGGSLLHQVEVRTPIECQIAELAARRATPDDIELLRKTLHELEAAERREQVVEADMRFHMQLARATGNSLFCTLLEAIVELMRASIATMNPGPARIVTVEIHRAIFQAVAVGDPDAAREAMSAHMREAENFLRKHSVE